MLRSPDEPNFFKSVLLKEFNLPSISSQSTMALKRKRSISSTSPAPITPPSHPPNACVHTTSASSGLSVQSSNHGISMSSHQSSAYPSYQSDDLPPQLHSRTRKRFRSKPDEASIHSTNSPTSCQVQLLTLLKIEPTKSFSLLRAPHQFLHPPLQTLPFQLPLKHPPANRPFTPIGPYQARLRPLLEPLQKDILRRTSSVKTVTLPCCPRWTSIYAWVGWMSHMKMWMSLRVGYAGDWCVRFAQLLREA